jgi:hypothetical protein
MDSCVLTCYCGDVFSQEELGRHLPTCQARKDQSPLCALVEDLKRGDPQQLIILKAELGLEMQEIEQKMRHQRP